jgi:hypothetical protein
MNHGLGSKQRRAMRRAVRTSCQAVSSAGFELIGERALDVSPRGMLVACDAPVALGEEVIVSLEIPGREPFWLDAEAEIARIVYGYRRGDPGYCAGLRFTYLERGARNELLARLAGVPPPVPQRRAAAAQASSACSSVLLRPVMRVGQPSWVVPAGVFSA